MMRVALALVLLLPTAAVADDDVEERIAALEQEVAYLREALSDVYDAIVALQAGAIEQEQAIQQLNYLGQLQLVLMDKRFEELAGERQESSPSSESSGGTP